MNANAAALKQQFEQLFPGKWLRTPGLRTPGLTEDNGDRLLRTGISEIDASIVSGFARRRINEWGGLTSSGKTTLLRGAVAHWCLNGLNTAYVDTFSRLVAADWAFVEQGLCGSVALNGQRRTGRIELSSLSKKGRQGKFFAVRVSEILAGRENRRDNQGSGANTRKDIWKEACWIAEQIIRSSVCDVVILDLGQSRRLPDRTYARLQRALDRSRTTLIILKDEPVRIKEQESGKSTNDTANGAWGCHTNVHFRWSAPIHFENTLNGAAAIVPAVQGILSRDGLTHNMEVRLIANVPNRLFTHPQIPDRRTSKTRARA